MNDVILIKNNWVWRSFRKGPEGSSFFSHLIKWIYMQQLFNVIIEMLLELISRYFKAIFESIWFLFNHLNYLFKSSFLLLVRKINFLISLFDYYFVKRLRS